MQFRFTAAAAAVLMLLAPALWNGFPLLQYDTGGYLARWHEGTLVLARSTVYGLFLYLGDTDKELERGVAVGDFLTNCVPVINLFRHRAEPMRLDGTQFENRVVADARRPEALEIHSIERVMATSPDGTEHPIEPFFGVRHDSAPGVRFWQASRRAAVGARDRGTEIFMSVLNRDVNAGAPANWVLSIDTASKE